MTWYGVGGVRARTESYAREDREIFDRENVEFLRRERRVGVDTEREGLSGVSMGLGCRLGRRSERGISLIQNALVLCQDR